MGPPVDGDVPMESTYGGAEAVKSSLIRYVLAVVPFLGDCVVLGCYWVIACAVGIRL